MMKQTLTAIDEVLETYFEKITDKTSPVPKATDKAKAAIQAIITQAVISELIYWQWKTDGHIELTGKEVEKRIKQIKGDV